MTVTIQRGALNGTMAVPGSKSDTIRAVLLALLSEGRSVIRNPLASGDGLSAKWAAIALGASISEEGNCWIVEGVGRNLRAPQTSLDLGNSGTATSFLSSIVTLAGKPVTLTGDEQIRRRPFKTLFDALGDLGAGVSVHNPNQVSRRSRSQALFMEDPSRFKASTANSSPACFWRARLRKLPSPSPSATDWKSRMSG